MDAYDIGRILLTLPLSVYLARDFTGTLVLLNSLLNPLLYCWKIREVRQAVKDTMRELFCLPGCPYIDIGYSH